MGKGKSWKRNKGQISKDKFHVVKDGSVKKNKDPKFKNTPTGKVSLINNCKAQNKNMKKNMVSQINIPKSFANAKNKNQNSPKQASKNNAKNLKKNSSNEKQSFTSKSGNSLSKGKVIVDPVETEPFDDSSSDINEESTSQEDSSLTNTDETFEDSNLNDTDETSEDDSDTNIPNILGKSLPDESDQDDEDFEEDEEEDEDSEKNEEDDDNDKKETVQHKGIKMFEGLRSKTNKNGANEEDQKDSDDEVASDDIDSDDIDSDDFVVTNKSNEGIDNEKQEDEEDDDDDDDDDYEKEVQNSKKLNQVKGDTSLIETDEDDYETQDDSSYIEDEDDDYDMDEELGLKTLLGKSIVDDDDDEDFNEEDEDDVDDDISSEDEDVEKPKQSEKRHLIIQNISKHTTEKKLMQLFSQFGSFTKVHDMYPLTIHVIRSKRRIPSMNNPLAIKRKLQSYTAEFIYETEESALNAEKAMHGMKIDGNYLCVKILANYYVPIDKKRTVLVTNLENDIEVNEFWKHFLVCGNIDRVDVVRDPLTMQCVNAHIRFYTEEAVAKAVKLKVEINGRPIIISNMDDVYRDRQPMNFVDRKVLIQLGTKRALSHKDNDKPLKKFKNNLEESVACGPKNEKNIKKHYKQEDNEEKKPAFQGQKVSLKNKKKKKKLDKKKKKMAEKLTAKSVKV